MQNRKLVENSASAKEINSALSNYVAILSEFLMENLAQCKRHVFSSLSPCGTYIIVGLFETGLEPKDGGDIWNYRPDSMPGASFAVVGGSDIFICKRNERGRWTKFAAQRDSIAILQLIF